MNNPTNPPPALTLGVSDPAPAPVAQGATPVEADAKNFVAEVMDASARQLVLVDFWAPWCGPCKQLMPMLEKLVAETNGAAKLVKVNIDKNPQIAQQLRVQSVPTVFAFFNRQIVDGFMGALPESQIRTWINELIKATGAKPTAGALNIPETLTQAEHFLAAGDPATAQALYSQVLAASPDNAEATAGVLRSLMAMGETEAATQLLAQLPPALAQDKLIAPVRTALELAQQSAQAGQADFKPLLDRLTANENDHQARFDLALAYYGQNDAESAIDCLLEIVRRDRKWQDDGARAQLVKIFEALGHTHPQTIEGRKMLSAILFA